MDAGTVGWSIVSPSANRAMKTSTAALAARVPGTRPLSPSTSQDSPHRVDMTMKTRVRRRPVIRPSTKNCRPTMTAVLTANANPMTRVETSATCRANAGIPASIWP